MELEGFAYGFGLFSLLLGLAGLVLYIWSIIWVYRDAESRGKSGLAVALLVALLFLATQPAALDDLQTPEQN